MATTGQKNKSYGLIIPKSGSTKTKANLKHNIFRDDSDDEVVPVPGTKFGQTNNTRIKTQTQLEIEKALKDDATVYEYDSIYDDMQQKKIEKNSTLLRGKEKKSLYIENLLKAAENRKKDDERRKERSVQKEREEEVVEGKFQDKEQFVTSAYKQKLLDMEKEAEEERRKAALEDAMDVTKQKDLSGFYRHFLNQQTGEEAVPDNTRVETQVKAEVKVEVKVEVKTEPDNSASRVEMPDDRDDTRSTSSSDSGSRSPPPSHQRQSIKEEKESSRSYRRRRTSTSPPPPPQSRTKRSRTRSRSRHTSRSRSHSRGRRSRSRSRPSNSRSRRSPNRPQSNRSRSRDRRHKIEKRSRKNRSSSRETSPKPGKSRNGDRGKNKDRSSNQRECIDRKEESEKCKTVGDKEADSEKTEVSLEEKYAKRHVGTAADEARARYLARKNQRAGVGKEAEDG